MKVKLSAWQTRVWDDPHRFKVINIGRRSGKTVVAILKMLEMAAEKKRVIWYVAPTYRQAKEIAWQLLKQYCPPAFRAEWNESELKCSLPNGTIIALKGADTPRSLVGVHVDFCIFDECAFYASWRDTWEALRPVLIDSKAPAWFVSTPNGFNHFYELYNQHLTNPEYASFHYTSYDNPYIDAEEIDKAREEMDSRSFAQEFLADFNRPAGVVYDDWNIDHYRPVAYDANLPLHLTFDFGVNDPTVMIWLQPNGSEVSVVDYYEASESSIEQLVSVINSKPYKKIELYTGDPAGNSRTQGMENVLSPISLLAKKGIYVRTKALASPVIPKQIRLAHSFMPRLFVDSDKCERFRDCLLNYRYPEKKESAVNQENELPIHDQYSHAMRAFEYWCVNWGDMPSTGPQVAVFAGGDSITGYGRTPAHLPGLNINKGYQPKARARTFR